MYKVLFLAGDIYPIGMELVFPYCSGRYTGGFSDPSEAAHAGHCIYNSSLRKEHTVTITNHTRHIEELAGEVIHYVDAREYPNAHICLDDIEKEVRLAHRHIDHLQNVTEFCARPAGGY